ncbi:MAG: HEAT repeat domain-containing protein, partial [Desulfocucumaceae bacterium]
MFGIKNKLPEAETLKKLLDTDQQWSKKLSKLLGKVPPAERWGLLQQLLPELEKHQARELTRLLFEAEPGYLVGRLKNQQEKYLAVEALGYLDSQENMELFGQLLNDKDANMQLCAAGALKNYAPAQVVPYLVKAMLHEQVPASRAGEVLLEMGELMREKLLEVYPLALPKVKSRFLELLTQQDC